MYAKISNNEITKYPYTLQDLYAENPNVSFPSDLDNATLARFGVARVIVIGQPEYNPITQDISEATPVYSKERKRWEQTWVVTPATEAEIAQRVADQTAQRDAMRAVAYRTESDPLFFKSQRGEATHQEWLDKVAEIKARFPA